MIKAMRYLAPQTPESSHFSRRRFLQVLSLGGAGFLIGCSAKKPSGTSQEKDDTTSSTGVAETVSLPGYE